MMSCTQGQMYAGHKGYSAGPPGPSPEGSISVLNGDWPGVSLLYMNSFQSRILFFFLSSLLLVFFCIPALYLFFLASICCVLSPYFWASVSRSSSDLAQVVDPYILLCRRSSGSLALTSTHSLSDSAKVLLLKEAIIGSRSGSRFLLSNDSGYLD